VAKAIFKVIRGFQSIGAALATSDLEARIDLYFSPAEELPKFLEKVPAHAAKVSKKLADEAMGRLKFESHTVTEKDEELRGMLRKKFGLREIPTDLFSEKGIYSYAVIAVGRQAVPLALVTLGEELSEFEVREAIEGQLKSLVPGFLMTIGVMTPDASRNPMAGMMGQQQPPDEFRKFVQTLESEFDVRRIDLGEGRPIPRQVSALLVVRPENLPDKAIYEIDQFLMRGGRLVVCADAVSFDLERAWQSQDANSVRKVDAGKFRDFLRHMGAEVGDSMILDTKSEVVTKAKRTRRGEIEFFTEQLPYFVYVEPPDGFDQTHDIVAKQRYVMLQWATPVTAAAGVPEGVTAREIAWTSAKSSTSTDLTQAQSQGKLGYEPPADARRQPVALVLTGAFPSFFAGKPSPGDEAAPETQGTDSAASRPAQRDRGIRLDRSKETSIVVIGDSDFLSAIVPQAFALEAPVLQQNMAFIRNAIDFGGPEARLMAIRNRENVQRPLLGLRGFDEEQRKEKTFLSRMLALTIPCVALLLFGFGWAIARRTRRPIPLPAAPHDKTRAAS
jgi:ABC-2 type transport system permease protein